MSYWWTVTLFNVEKYIRLFARGEKRRFLQQERIFPARPKAKPENKGGFFVKAQIFGEVRKFFVTPPFLKAQKEGGFLNQDRQAFYRRGEVFARCPRPKFFWKALSKFLVAQRIAFCQPEWPPFFEDEQEFFRSTRRNVFAHRKLFHGALSKKVIFLVTEDSFCPARVFGTHRGLFIAVFRPTRFLLSNFSRIFLGRRVFGRVERFLAPCFSRTNIFRGREILFEPPRSFYRRRGFSIATF